MPVAIPESHADLLYEAYTVTLATLLPNGYPHANPVWCEYDGTYVYINTAVGRQKDKDLQNNPKVSISVFDPQTPLRWLEVRGNVIARTEEGAADHINMLAQAYWGTDYYVGKRAALKGKQIRVKYTIDPVRVLTGMP